VETLFAASLSVVRRFTAGRGLFYCLLARRQLARPVDGFNGWTYAFSTP